LAGCAVQPRLSDLDKSNLWEIRQQELSQIDEWTLKGRIAIQTEKDSWSAGLQWQQHKQDYAIRIVAPLGRGSYELTGNKQGVMLRTNKNEIFEASTPEVLMQRNLGWQLPVSGLVYWIRGVPQISLEDKNFNLDEQGRINEMNQDGWQIKYHRYDEHDGHQMPSKLFIENDKLKVRIIIKDWTFL